MASYDTIQALDVVVKHGLPSAMEAVMLDLERARMEREDFRQGYSPANGTFESNEPDDNAVRELFAAAASHQQRLMYCLARVRRLYQSEPRAPKYRKRYVSQIIGDLL